jgi:hypothetical protein
MSANKLNSEFDRDAGCTPYWCRLIQNHALRLFTALCQTYLQDRDETESP